jgi:hypothetical protein
MLGRNGWLLARWDILVLCSPIDRDALTDWGPSFII